MAEDRVTIDVNTLMDDADARVVEFDGDAGGDVYSFALQYDVLEALSGDRPDDEAVQLFNRHIDEIADFAATALARDPNQIVVTISENDME